MLVPEPFSAFDVWPATKEQNHEFLYNCIMVFDYQAFDMDLTLRIKYMSQRIYLHVSLQFDMQTP